MDDKWRINYGLVVTVAALLIMFAPFYFTALETAESISNGESESLTFSCSKDDKWNTTSCYCRTDSIYYDLVAYCASWTDNNNPARIVK